MAELFLRGGGMNFLDDTIIQMVVAFVAGAPARRLLPLSRRFVPEPVQMPYIVTDGMSRRRWRLAVWRGLVAACEFRALADLIRRFRMRDVDLRMTSIAGNMCCSICWYRGARVVLVPQATLQTRLRRPVWEDIEAFRAFINDRIVHVEISVCRNCRMRCGMQLSV